MLNRIEKVVCKTCNKANLLSHYLEFRTSNNRPYLFDECSDCRHSKPNIYLRRCPQCNKNKSIVEYQANPHCKNGYGGYCSVCKKEIDQKRYTPRPKPQPLVNSKNLTYNNKKEYDRAYHREYYHKTKDRQAIKC